MPQKPTKTHSNSSRHSEVPDGEINAATVHVIASEITDDSTEMEQAGPSSAGNLHHPNLQEQFEKYGIRNYELARCCDIYQLYIFSIKKIDELSYLYNPVMISN